ncbi:MAG: class I SAM-dependent methyltransferase, partial [Pseudomonadota bacterium]
MPDTPDQNTAYALQTPEDSRALYARWAKTYDSDFAVQHDYVLPAAVAEAFAAAGRGPVLDIGAGTGLCGAALSALGVGPVDGTDISEDMLGQAAGKLVYRTLFAGNVLKRLDVPDGAYQGVVSSGTFTHGHVGPAGLTEVLRVLSPGGMAVLSVHAEHYAAQGF